MYNFLEQSAHEKPIVFGMFSTAMGWGVGVVSYFKVYNDWITLIGTTAGTVAAVCTAIIMFRKVIRKDYNKDGR